MIEKLKKLNKKHIELNKNNPKELKKYKLIAEILNKKDCFLNMNIEYAYAILRDLQISEKDLKNVYTQLISYHQNENN